jgi:hypothetical protein
VGERRGPVVVVGRPRSGTRLVAKLLEQSGYYLGADCTTGRLDSISWFQRFVVPLVTSRWFPDWPDDHAADRFAEHLLEEVWPRFLGGRRLPARWGWKYPETLFVLPLIRRRFPELSVIHVIRDGRDVCQSRGGFFQATGPQADPPGWDPGEVPEWARRTQAAPARPSYREFCDAVTFGDADAVTWRRIELDDPAARARNRFTIGMQAWAFAVGTAQAHGAALGPRYLEVRYEELCRDPRATATSLGQWLGSPLPVASLEGIVRRVWPPASTERSGRSLSARERRDLDGAAALHGDLLARLGYR